MRNDLTYIRFYWSHGRRESLHTTVGATAMGGLAKMLRLAARTFLAVDVDVHVTFIGPPRFGCIELSFAVDYIPLVTEMAANIPAGSGELGEQMRRLANENGGMIGALALLWQIVAGKALWDIYQERGRVRSSGPEKILEISVAQHLSTSGTMQIIMETVVEVLAESMADRVEIQFRDYPPAVIDSALVTAISIRVPPHSTKTTAPIQKDGEMLERLDKLRRVIDNEPQIRAYPNRPAMRPGFPVTDLDGSPHEGFVITGPPANDP